MNKPKIFGIIVVVLAFVGTSVAFSNCGQSRYEGPNTATPVVVDDESFLNGDAVQVGGNVANITAQGTDLVGDGYVCIPSFTETPQVRVNRKYFNGSTSVTEHIGSQLYPATPNYLGATSNCEGGTPYGFDISVPLTSFETGGLTITDTNVSDQVFYVEVLLPGNVLAGGEDIYVPLPGSVYIPSGLSTGYHEVTDQPGTVRYVYYNDINLLIDDDPSTVAVVYYCTVTSTDVVTQYQTTQGVFDQISTITETDCPDFIVNDTEDPVDPTQPGNILYLLYGGTQYINIDGGYCVNDVVTDPTHTYEQISDNDFAALQTLNLFTGLPCNDTRWNDSDSGGGSDTINRVLFGGVQYVFINGNYCVNDSIPDTNNTYNEISQSDFDALIAAGEEFTGLPCNDPNLGDNDGGGDDTVVTRVVVDNLQHVFINGNYCINDSITDTNNTYNEISQADLDAMKAAGEEFTGLPCNDPNLAGDDSGSTPTATSLADVDDGQYAESNGATVLKKVDDSTACRVTTGLSGVQYGDEDAAVMATVELLTAAWDGTLICSN